MSKIVVLGTGSWGTTLAIVLSRQGPGVTLLARDAGESALLRETGENRRFLPDMPFPPALEITHDAERALVGCAVLLLVAPAQSMRQNVRSLAALLPRDPAQGPILVSCAKGLELGSLARMSQVIRSELPAAWHDNVAGMSGPNIAHEVVREHPAVSVVAAEDITVAERVQRLVNRPRLRVYTNNDLIGIELAGALKNIIALGAGMSDGLKAGDNAKAAFITRGLAEISRLGLAEGANLFTFAGLAGVGDVIATCASPYSRNRRLGEYLVMGKTVEQFKQDTGQVAEGVPTTIAARELARKHGVDMPITEEMYQIVFAGKHPLAALAALMERDPTGELRGMMGE